MPLKVGYLRAGQEDVLTGPGGRLLLLDLKFHDLGRMLNDLGDVRPVTGSNFTKNTLIDPDDTTNKPVALEKSFFQLGGSRMNSVLTQKTPIWLKEQYGGLSGLIMQNMP